MQREAAAQDSQNRQTIVTGGPGDGNVSIGFTEKDMEAWADFIPPMNSGALITMRLMNMVLDKLNIIHGLRWDLIRQAVQDCNQNYRLIKDVLIAKGEDPVNEITAFFAVNPRLRTRPRLPKRNARVDYRTYTPFIIVKKDQVLARLRPRREGKNGMNVHGESLPFQTVQPAGVRGGENTRTEGDLILAEIDGQMLEKGGILDVKDTLTIKGPVGYATGNIIFPGNVYINGPVSDGFKIYSGGSVIIKQTFDVTDAVTRGDLNVSGGIIGRGRGLLKIGGSLKTKFIENCRAAVRKNVLVDRAVINSQVWTLDILEMGDRGLILGSEVYALKKIRTGGIGRKEGKSSRIHCGVDFAIEQEKETHNNLIKILGLRIMKFREQLESEMDPEKRARLHENLDQAMEKQRESSDKLTELLKKTVHDESAVVEVSGEVVPGTLIEICHVGFSVNEVLHRVRIRLEQGLVITEPLC
ncbi:MAG: FapA family protein [Treponema sp.]|nr:FapA family protein [Treponema sp.]